MAFNTALRDPPSMSRNIAEITPKIMDMFYKDVNTTSVDIDEVCRDLCIPEDLGLDKEFNNRVKGVWLETWLCTDTYVGTSAIIFDGKLIGFCSKSARKSDANFSWLDTASVESLKAFVLERIQAHRHVPDNIVDTPPTNIMLMDDPGYNESYYRRFV